MLRNLSDTHRYVYQHPKERATASSRDTITTIIIRGNGSDVKQWESTKDKSEVVLDVLYHKYIILKYTH